MLWKYLFWEFVWGLFSLFLLLPCTGKVNSKAWSGIRVWQYLHKCWWRSCKSRAAIQVLSGIASCTKFAQSLFLHNTKDCTCSVGGAGQWRLCFLYSTIFAQLVVGDLTKPSSSTVLAEIAQCLCQKMFLNYHTKLIYPQLSDPDNFVMLWWYLGYCLIFLDSRFNLSR